MKRELDRFSEYAEFVVSQNKFIAIRGGQRRGRRLDTQCVELQLAAGTCRMSGERPIRPCARECPRANGRFLRPGNDELRAVRDAQFLSQELKRSPSPARQRGGGRRTFCENGSYAMADLAAQAPGATHPPGLATFLGRFQPNGPFRPFNPGHAPTAAQSTELKRAPHGQLL